METRGDRRAQGTPERIKGNLKRTVERQRQEDGRLVAVKRFHAPGWGALRDAMRARTEARALRRAAALGLPVPEVQSMAREDGKWVLRTRWVTGARPLDDVLRGPAADRPASRVRLARLLGELLSQMDGAGMLHPDLHPGNVLVDDRGALWLIDLARVRFHRPRRSVRRSFVRAAARLRELAPPGFRAAALASWRRQSVGGSPPDYDIPATEAELRSLRIEDTLARVPVWSRTSSATRVAPESDGGRRVLVRALEDAAPMEGWHTEVFRGDRDACTSIWSTLVRATLHGLPAPKPRSIRLDAPHCVTFDVPAGSRPSDDVDARLNELLHDRGLCLAPTGATGRGRTLVDASGRTLVHPEAELRRAAP